MNLPLMEKNCILPKEETMAATAIMANEVEIKEAMSTLRLDNWIDDVLDEIELNRRLKISLEQADRGETMSMEELEKRTAEKMKNGYYTRNRR